MSEPFLGQIKMFGFNFAPRGWATCDGQLLAINSNQSLFAILGTTYTGEFEPIQEIHDALVKLNATARPGCDHGYSAGHRLENRRRRALFPAWLDEYIHRGQIGSNVRLTATELDSL